MVHYSETMSQHERAIRDYEISGRLSDASKEITSMVKDFTLESVSHVYDGRDISNAEVELGIRRMIDQCALFFYNRGYLKKNKGRNICSVNMDRNNRNVTVSIYPRCAKRAFTFAMSIE